MKLIIGCNSFGCFGDKVFFVIIQKQYFGEMVKKVFIIFYEKIKGYIYVFVLFGFFFFLEKVIFVK